MLPQVQTLLTPEEYLAIERSAESKSEYLHGEMFAMAGASEQHNLIAGNIFASLHIQLRSRPCKVYMSDMRVQVSPTGLYTYPDVMVVCETTRFADAQNDTVLNPSVIIEVLSDSTEGYDRGKKFEHYRQLSSLQEYVLVAQERYHLEHYWRQPNGHWFFTEYSDPQSMISFPTLTCEFLLSDFYDKVVFAI